jgi:sugar phosphate isomerase/epimerase
MGLDGGIVMLGQRTSRFTKPQFAEWIEFLYATAADRGVVLPAWINEETGEVLQNANA